MKEKIVGTNENGDKALWNLLGEARKIEAGPMFSRNVVREIRLSDSTSSSVFGQVSHWFRKPSILAATAAVLIGAGMVVIQNRSSISVVEGPVSPAEAVDLIDPATEFESIETLGQLMAVSDPGLLNDEDLINLLF